MLKKLLFLIISLGLFILNPLCASDEQERKPLINIQYERLEYTVLSPNFSVPLVDVLPYLPQDLWQLISFHLIFNQDTLIENWSMTDAVSLSSCCISFRTYFNSEPIFNLIRGIFILSHQSSSFFLRHSMSPQISEEAVHQLKELLEKQKHLKLKLDPIETTGEQSHRVKALLLSAVGTTIRDLGILTPTLLSYAKENPDSCRSDAVEIDMESISQATGQAIPSYEFNWRREYKRIFHNKYAVASMTLLLSTVFIYEGIYLYNQYPQKQATEAFYAMLNHTQLSIPFDYWGDHDQDAMECFQKSDLNGGWAWMWYNDRTWMGSKGYCNFPTPCCGQASCYPGNMSDWIHFVDNYSKGINYTFWFDHVMAIFNGLKHNPQNTLCSLNPDGKSITCGSAFTWLSQLPSRYWNCDDTICFQITRGDAQCAHDRVINEWQRTFALYVGLGSWSIPFLFMWLWLIGFYL